MKALVLTDDHALRLTARPVPRLASPRDVLVRVRQTGICGTDLGVLNGKFSAVPGTIMGHEAVGDVVEAGPDASMLRPGDRVVVNPTLYCGHCAACLRGALNHCLHKAGNEVGIDRDGSYAEYLVLPEQFLHQIPAYMCDDRAVVIEPLACVLSNLGAAKLMPGDPVMILGGGPIGLLCAMVAGHMGSQVTVIERDPYRRKLAPGLLAMGPDDDLAVIGPDELDQSKVTPIIIDAVGNQLSTALERVASGGTVVIMGYDRRAEVAVRPLDILQRGITIVGAGDYNSQIFPRAIEMARRLPLERLITHRFTLDRHADAFAVLAGSDSGYSAQKVIIESRTGDAGDSTRREK
jgi:2-desacetyl-2-hydroxyethyl bacteriochlorophyllide A dehydrogenase